MTNPKEGELLFTEGDWALRTRSRLDPASRISRLWHKCDRHWWYVWTKDPACSKCHQQPPTELVGLKNLHDWER